MVSCSYNNLLDLASDDGGGSSSLGLGKRLTRVMTVAGIVSDLDDADEAEEGSPKSRQQRVIVVGNQLPLRAHRRPDDGKWGFSWDEDSLLFQLRDGLGAGDGVEVLYVGCLRPGDQEVVEPAEQEEVSRQLLDVFRCVPAFVPGELHSRFYHGFCKQHLWPLFHYMLPLSRDLGGRFDRSLWQAYVSVNKLFADKVMEVISGDGADFVWVHDYHLMLLPTFLRRRFNRVRLGFFLHCPFPSSEIYRTLPVRDELLRALLNADLIGFHTFDYARHFLSSCSRVLGLGYESKRGYIGIDYYGRTVNIKILPVGVHMGQLAHAMALPETEARVADLVAGTGRFRGKTVLLGVDDMDIFKGISLKLLAMEQVLEQHPEWRGKLVLVQVANPARGRGRDVQEVQHETYSTVDRINRRYGAGAPPDGYEPIVLIDRPLEFYERVAYYAIAECCLVTAVRDGMNLIPYEYIVSRQGLGLHEPAPARSMLVVSEFIGCSPSLSGAIRVNPWNVDAVAEAMYAALAMGDAEKQLRHDKNYRYVNTHDAGYWARSFVQDLDRACRDHARRRCWGLGFGLGFRVVALDPSFRKLSLDHIVAAYRRANHRAILLDYDGTMHSSSGSVSRSPAPETIAILNRLCRDPRNTVYLVGASDKDTLAAWFAACHGSLVLAAEHGYFLRQRQGSEWTTTCAAASFEWKQIAEPIMELYTEATDGSSIESKESGMAWHHEHADPDFGACQAKELLDHLETVLANEPVSVKSSHGIVEVKPQGVTKGLVAEQLLSAMQKKGIRADFVLFVGDDRSDEDMFEVINDAATGTELSPVAEVFACTVGQKPSKAKYYLEDTAEIIRMLQGLADASDLTMVHQPIPASTSI